MISNIDLTSFGLRKTEMISNIALTSFGLRKT